MKPLLTLILAASHLAAEPLRLEVSEVAAPSADGFHMGTSKSPDGSVIGINSRFLTMDGKPWLPVMGEFHYTRCPEDEWREEQLRMKAGGIDIAATYVFWNHHEEEEGVWRWDGDRDLRRFIELCKETGMLASVRLGPWCHGEVRNGGVPDWAIAKGWKLRSGDPAYLEHVKTIYQQIARQLDGLLWKDGGPVMAVQVENEFRGRAGHLLKLKEIARDCGIDVPLYTRTGWPALADAMPFGEIAPLFGAYAEGFWDRSLRPMPGKYWAAFRFSDVRTDAAIATEQLGERAAKDEADANLYPYLTCELGGGMMSSYHRRILMRPEDIAAVALTKVGSGGNLPGYYMVHGGVNPEGKLTTLQETQDSPMTNYNDMPVTNYDFQAPLGMFGQTRPHYHSLRRMHLMCRDFGDVLAPMPPFLPEKQPGGADDVSTLRWAVRSDGNAGFLFVNNHQRGAEMPAHEDVSFAIDRKDGSLVFPQKPVTVRPGAGFVWPFGLDLGFGVTLESATVQPICRIDEPDARTVFFAETPGVSPVITLPGQAPRTIVPGRGVAMRIPSAEGELRLVVLGEKDSLALWKGEAAGRERVVLSRADIVFDAGTIRLRAEDPTQLAALVFPPLDGTKASEGLFTPLTVPTPEPRTVEITAKKLRDAGPPREIKMGRNKVAAAPVDADFEQAEAWELRLPEGYDPAALDDLLRIRYQGDVARVWIGGRLVIDDFHNGRPLELGLRRHASKLREAGALTLEILPLKAGAPVFHPAAPKDDVLLALDAAEIVPRYRATGE